MRPISLQIIRLVAGIALGMAIILNGMQWSGAAQMNDYTWDQSRTSEPSQTVPFSIGLNHLAEGDYPRRNIFLLIGAQDFSEANLRKVFAELAKKYDWPEQLWITAFSDASMLQRAMN